MKAIELCLNRFDEDTKRSFLDLYTKIDEDAKPTIETVVPESSLAEEMSNAVKLKMTPAGIPNTMTTIPDSVAETLGNTNGNQ